MGDTTEGRSLQISPKYTVDFWRGLDLNPDAPKQADWEKAIDVLRDRIEGRFLKPAQTLIDAEKDNKRPTFGFAILALDCLVLETIQAFRDGVTDHMGRSGALFVAFLATWQPFVSCLGGSTDAAKKASEFYKQGRCALHHSGSTDKLTVGISGPMMRFEDDRRIAVNRTVFHTELEAEFQRYLGVLRNPEAIVPRRNFVAKMNPICGA